ncbi:hypothetical protein EGJ83_03640 [Pseudomonas aeruginosa]|nr:hypothetical protein EGJ83_03640 [Pseudomonas aeruginosa]
MRRCGGAAPGWGGRDRSRREDGAARRAPAGTGGIGAGRAGGTGGGLAGARAAGSGGTGGRAG